MPEIKGALEATGVMPRGTTPAEMADIVRSESAKWKKVIDQTGVVAE
jgi:tripartite-type tricarboxylate transporter receptor subunit TctC